MCTRLVLPLVAIAAAGTGWAQSAGERDPGYYQRYVTGAPDDPSEAWLLAYGGRLYDMWWQPLGRDPPDRTHPAYPAGGAATGAATWRCVTCHGWDYRGDGATPQQGGMRAMAGADPARIAAALRGPGHRYTKDMIPDAALAALALFVSKGQHDTDAVIDRGSGRVHGNPARGRAIYQNLCAICHDYDGRAWISGEGDGLDSLAAVAARDPWQALHKVRNGVPNADMPAMRAFDLQTVLDVLAYAQTLSAR